MKVNVQFEGESLCEVRKLSNQFVKTLQNVDVHSQDNTEEYIMNCINIAFQKLHQNKKKL